MYEYFDYEYEYWSHEYEYEYRGHKYEYEYSGYEYEYFKFVLDYEYQVLHLWATVISICKKRVGSDKFNQLIYYWLYIAARNKRYNSVCLIY